MRILNMSCLYFRVVTNKEEKNETSPIPAQWCHKRRVSANYANAKRRKIQLNRL